MVEIKLKILQLNEIQQIVAKYDAAKNRKSFSHKRLPVINQFR
jgi:hypothetical protein